MHLNKVFILLVVLILCLMSSCAMLLDVLSGNCTCIYPGCNERAENNSVYCSYHKPRYFR